MTEKCSVCGYNVIQPNGVRSAPYLIVGEKPSFDDQRIGIPFTGNIQDMLKYELARVGIQLQRCRLITAWPHADGKNPECLNQHFGLVLQELMINRTAVLFVGDGLPQMFGAPPLKDISGLVVDVLPNINLTGRFVFVGSLFGYQGGTIGELRFGLNNLRGEL